MNVAIIPARGGSVRIPRKNIREFHGKPIISYSVEVAQRCGIFDVVMVSTDDHDISAIARDAGCEVFVRERDEGVRGTQEVAAEAVKGMDSVRYVCCIYPTAPMLNAHDLMRGFHEVSTREDVWFAFSCGTDPLRDAGQFYWSKNSMLQAGAHIFGQHTALIAVDENRVCDINTPEDWERAEQMYANLHRIEPAGMCTRPGSLTERWAA